MEGIETHRGAALDFECELVGGEGRPGVSVLVVRGIGGVGRGGEDVGGTSAVARK